MIFQKKKKTHTHGNMIFSSGVLKRWSSQKGRTGTWSFMYYLERWYLPSQKHDIFSLDGKWKIIFLKKYTGARYFLCIRAGVTNVVLGPSTKKNSGWPSPSKMHLKTIDTLGWHSRKGSNDSLCFYGEFTLIGVFIYCFPAKKPVNLIYRMEVWLLL